MGGKAKSGLLQRDPILQNIVYSMRRALVEPYKGREHKPYPPLA